MRIDRAERLVAAMEAAPDERFNMATLFSINGEPTGRYGGEDPGQHTCGTAACIAGWGIWVAGDEISPGWNGLINATQVAEWLGIRHYAGDLLFMSAGYHFVGSTQLTRLRAIAVLRDMVQQARSRRRTILPNWEKFDRQGRVV